MRADYEALFDLADTPLWSVEFARVFEAFEALRAEGVESLTEAIEARPGLLVELADRVRIVEVNRAALELHEAASKEELLAALDRVFVPEAMVAFQRQVEVLWAGQTRCQVEAMVGTLQGARREILVTLRLQGTTAVVTAAPRGPSLTPAPLNTARPLQEHHLAAFVRDAPMAVAMLDEQLRYLAWSDEWVRMHRLNASALTGRPHLSVFPSLPEAARERLHAALAGQRSSVEGDPIQRVDGSTDYVTWRTTPWREKGQVGGILIYTELVTDRVLLERELVAHNESLATANAEMEEFIRALSHDLKSPVRGLSYLVEFALEDFDSDPEGAREGLRSIANRVGQFDRVIADLLDYHRLGPADEPKPIDLRRMVAEIVALLDLPEGFSVEVCSAPEDFVASRGAFRQVLMNGIANALKHHDQEAGRVEIHHREDAAAHTFEIRDDGPGVPERLREQVFTLFRTLRPREDVEKGTGVGLAIVRKAVRRAGGRVALEANEPRGAKLVVRWPK